MSLQPIGGSVQDPLFVWISNVFSIDQLNTIAPILVIMSLSEIKQMIFEQISNDKFAEDFQVSSGCVRKQ